MKLEKQNILFLVRATQHGGTENVVIQLCRIFQPLVNNIIVCSANGFQVGLLHNMGIRHYEIPDLENKYPQTILKILKVLDKIIEKEQITIVHSHHRMAALYTKLLSTKYSLIEINTAHNTFKNKRLLTQLAYYNMNIVACGEKVKDNLVEIFRIPDKQITVIHNAVEKAEDGIIVDDQIAELHNNGCFIVGNIGRLSEQKGMKYYIDAIPKVLKVYSNVKFLIIGEGEDRKKLEDMVSSKGLNDYVTFMGFRPNPQNAMKQIDLLVLSSLWEGLPLTPIEAFSVGKTVVGTAVDGTVEIIEDGKSGFLIKPQNSDEIADKVIWFIEHPEEKKIMEMNAFKRYQQEFTFEIFSKKYVDLYMNVINK